MAAAPPSHPAHASRIAELEAAPRRGRALHWAAFAGAVFSFLLLAGWMASPDAPVPQGVLLLDLLLSAAAVAEFFTRSGFHWDKLRYVRAHVFDFFAMVPALWLVLRGFPYEGWWVWLLLAARATRAVDRVLGDGFVRRKIVALLEAFEEETTDRVMLRILARVEADLEGGRFGDAVGDALARNRDEVLQRVREATPLEGLPGELARISGLDAALARAEARAYDAVVEVLRSSEVDRALRDVVASTFANLRAEIRRKAWREELGFRPRPEPAAAQEQSS